MYTSGKRIFGLILAIAASLLGIDEISSVWQTSQVDEREDATAFVQLAGKEQNVTLIFQIPQAEANLLYTENSTEHDLTPIAIMIQQKNPDKDLVMPTDKSVNSQSI